MARYVLPVVGAAIGGYFGGATGAQLGWTIGSLVGNAVDPQIIKGPSVGDLQQQTSQEGGPRPIIFGLSQPIAGNIVACSDPKIVNRYSGGKGGGPITQTKAIFRTYAIGVCRGPIGGFVRIWRNGSLVYDARPGSGMEEQNINFMKTARFFYGDYEQNPSPDLEALFGVGNTPAMRGTAYMVVSNEDLTQLSGAVPQYNFQVSRCPVPTFDPALVVVGSDSRGPFYTIDGENFSAARSGATTADALAYGNDYFVAANRSANLFRSLNGKDWASIVAPANFIDAVAFGNGVFAAATFPGGVTQTRIYYSNDGLQWTGSNTVNMHESITRMFFIGGYFVGCGQFGTVYTSIDGIAWGAEDLGNRVRCAEYGDGIYMIGGLGGRIWTASTTPFVFTQVSTALDNQVEYLKFYHGNFYCTTNLGGLFVSADHGVTWTQITTVPATPLGALGIFNDEFYCGDASGNLYKTTDFVSWGTIDAGINAIVWDMQFGGIPEETP